MNAKKSTIGTMIRKRRIELDMTQQELGDRSGITQAHISRIESGEYNLSAVTICKLARALRISVDELLDAAEKKAV